MPEHPQYAIHPSIAYTQAVIAGMKQKTGRSLEEWIAVVEEHGPEAERARIDWLRREHGLGMNYAGWISACAAGRGDDNTDPSAYLRKAPEYVDAMYSGKRAGLRPLHDRIIEVGRRLFPDLKICPCETIVPFYRNHVFAQIKPAANDRIDLGVALRDTAAGGRLIDTGGFARKDRITHRIAIRSLEDIDAEVEQWLCKAYEMDG